MTVRASESTVDIKIGTPLRSNILLTLGNFIEAVWPGAQLVTNEDKFTKQVIFRIDPAARTDVDDDEAADMFVAPDEFDVDVLTMGPEGVQTLTPEIIGANFLPVIKEAFEKNPEAENYLEFTLIDKEDHHRYLLTFCRSAQQTPHELRMAAEQKLEDARGKIHREYAATIYALLGHPRGGRPDTYEDGLKAALDAVRQLGFPYTGYSDGED
ncbi:hypothetical protein [Paenarthrobacter sp. YJN-5]|uniref:hypothetical protein n=1 Tax=Paenarthrobacter sp. YJN-5 TaxID=2735316 RepID=UPI0018785EC5|nr:hypothetical protein [Paenarthrobacter sp. YJN-5]QOT19394.1 hypothetical protein HMI59_22335 [Paenarthrobacter sp. YJN-5]